MFKIKGEYAKLTGAGDSLDKILSVELSDDAKRWLRRKTDKVNWQIGAFVLETINEIYGLKLILFEDWDLATMSDNEFLFMNVQLSIKMDDVSFLELDETMRREVRIIFDAIDNPKYFLHSIDGYFFPDSDGNIDIDYKNHLLARL
jgi:hypothetical protein